MHMVFKGLVARYIHAVGQLVALWRDSFLSPDCTSEIDDGFWLVHIFSEGEPKGLGSDGLAGLQFFLPQCAGNLRHAWKLQKVWQKLEPPRRVLPLSPLRLS